MEKRSDRHGDRERLKAAEANLRRQLAELDQIYKYSPVGLVVVDRNLRFVRANERMAEIDGKSVEEHIGRTLCEVLPELAEQLQAIYQLVLDTGEPLVNLEIRGATPKAPEATRYWLANYHPLRSDTGEILGVLGAVTEITEQRQAQEDLLLTQFSLDHASDSVHWIDENARLVYVNESACQELGYSREELLQMTVLDIDPEWTMEQWRRFWEEFKETRSGAFESVHRTKQGRVFPVEIRVSFIDFRGKTLDCAYSRDITERKRAEEALRETTQMLKLVLDTIPVPVWWKNRDGVYLGSNRLGAAAAGYDLPEDIVGKTDYDLSWRSEDAESYRADDLAVMRSGVPRLNYEEKQRKAGGRDIWIRTSKVPLRDGDGNVIGVLGTFEDITQRKEAEEALRRSEAFLDTIIECSPISMWISDDKGTAIRLNQACRDLFHLADDEIVGSYNLFQDNILEEKGLMPKIRRVFEKGQTAKFTFWYESSRLEQFQFQPLMLYLDVTISPVLDAAGRVTNAIVQHVDLTDRERAESERRALEQRLEDQKRRFYRETILSVTDGKLNVCEAHEVREYISGALSKVDVCKSEDVGRARRELEAFCIANEMTCESLGIFLVGAGEAVTNALKHGECGRVYFGKTGTEIWVAVKDRGPGIESLLLPRAVLWRGYSTKPSLGMGYTIMLDAADRILLKTGPHGTTVVLTKSLEEQENALLDAMPSI